MAGNVTELRVHGVGGPSPQRLLADPYPERIVGDDTTGFYRSRHAPTLEAYVWGGLTTRGRRRSLWFLLLPFTLANVTGWAHPRSAPVRRARFRFVAALSGYALTVVYALWVFQLSTRALPHLCHDAYACFPATWRLDVLGLSLRLPALGADPVWRASVHGAVAVTIMALLFNVAGRTLLSHEGVRPPDSVPAGSPSRWQWRADSLEDGGFWRNFLPARELAGQHLGLVLATLGAVVVHSVATSGGGATESNVAWNWAALGPALAALALLRLLVVGTGRWSGLLRDIALLGAGAGAYLLWWPGWLPPPALILAPLCLAAILAVPAVRLAGRASPTPCRLMRTGVVLLLILAGTMTLAHTAGVGVALVLGGIVQFTMIAAVATTSVLCSTRGWWRPVVAATLGGLLVPWFFGGAELALLASARGWGEARRVGLREPQFVLFDLPAIVSLVGLVAFLIYAIAMWRAGVEARPQVEADYADLIERRVGPTIAADPGFRAARHHWQNRVARLRGSSSFYLEHAAAPLLVLTAATLVTSFVLFLGRVGVTGSSPAWNLFSRVQFWRWTFDTSLPDGASLEVVLGTLSTVLVVGGFVFGSWIVRRSVKQDSFRRQVGKLFDVLTFWPRRFHPLAAAPYAERAVPQLQMRLDTLRGEGGGVVVVAHSQGTVTAAAALAQLPADMLARVALVTYGCPLRSLYQPWFPAYWDRALLERIQAPLFPVGADTPPVRWRNFYRGTDYIGKDLFPGEQPDRDTRLLEVDTGPDQRWQVWPPIASHSDYESEPDVAAWVALAVAELGRP